MLGKLVATRLPASCAGEAIGESSGRHSASLQRPMPSASRVSTSAPDSATRSLPVRPMSMAPSAQSTGISSVRKKVMSIGISPTRAKRLRSCRRKLRPACLSNSAASSLSRPLLGTPIRSLDIGKWPVTRSQWPEVRQRLWPLATGSWPLATGPLLHRHHGSGGLLIEPRLAEPAGDFGLDLLELDVVIGEQHEQVVNEV